MKTKMLTLIAIGALLCTTLALVDADAADSGFDITDDDKTTVHFDAAAEHIVVCGLGPTLTIADAGAISKVIAVDKYSTYSSSKNEKLKDLDAMDLGSFYGSTNHEKIVTELINLVENGKLSKDDPIILTTYKTNTELKAKLADAGFTKVLRWDTSSVGSYSDIVDFVGDITRIATGEKSDVVSNMEKTVQTVKDGVSGVAADEKKKALSVWYSSSKSEIMVNNIGIAQSMLEVCNATQVGYKADGGQYYGDEATVISLLESNPGCVIFLSSAWASAGKTVEDFRNDVLGGRTDFKIIQMGALWNNYCPESADGLLEMAKAIYPERFGVDPDPTPERGDGNSNIFMWVVVLTIAIIIGAAAYVVFKRTHG